MPPKKRKCDTVVAGARRLTRLQARIYNTPTTEALSQSPKGSLASPSCFRKDANTFPRDAKTSRGRKVNEEQETVLVISDESDNECDEYLWVLSTVNELSGEANLPDELIDRSNDPSLQAYSDKDSQSLSDSPSDFEAEMATYARRHANIQSNSRARITGNDHRHCGATTSNVNGLKTYARRHANIQSNSRARITRNDHRHCLATTSNVNGGFTVKNSSSSKIIDDVRRNLNIPFSAFFGENVSEQNVSRNIVGNGIGTMPREKSATAVERLPKAACNLTRTSSFGLTEMINMYNLEPMMEEVQSPAVDTVHGYVVKQEFVSILRRIIDKYGDIVVNFSMESIQSRSSSLEAICQIIQSLQTKSFNDLSLAEISSMLAQVRDFRKIGMKAKWLEKRLEDMEAAKHAMKESSSLKDEKHKNDELLKELRTKLEDDKTQMNDCRTQILLLIDSINEQRRKLEVYEAKNQELQENEILTMEDLKKALDNEKRLNQTTLESIRKVQLFVAHPLVDDLL